MSLTRAAGGTSVEFCLTRVSAQQPLLALTFLSSLLGEPGRFRGDMLGEMGLHRGQACTCLRNKGDLLQLCLSAARGSPPKDVQSVVLL